MCHNLSSIVPLYHTQSSHTPFSQLPIDHKPVVEGHVGKLNISPHTIKLSGLITHSFLCINFRVNSFGNQIIPIPSYRLECSVNDPYFQVFELSIPQIALLRPNEIDVEYTLRICGLLMVKTDDYLSMLPFCLQVQAYMKKSQTADLCLSDEVDRNWYTIKEGLYLFDLIERKV